MTICIKIFSCAHADSKAKNSTINNHRTDMEPVHYTLCVAAVAAAVVVAVIVMCCMALPLWG